MRWQNRLTTLLRIEYPFVQAPMLGITTPAMVAAISNAGGLGSLPVGGLSADVTRSLIKETKALTNKPFAVNLFTHTNPDSIDESSFDSMQQFLVTLAANENIPYTAPIAENLAFFSYHDQIDILAQEKIPIVSFTFGIPDDDSIITLKNSGARLIGTATCVEEALLLETKFIDVVTAQGAEAGGHRGSFINGKNPPMIGSLSLIPQIVDAIRLPVLAAGGIADGRSMVAAFILGSQGVQVGSAFIASHESAAVNAHKHIVQNSSATASVLTRSFSGRWARGIQNKLMESVEGSGLTIPAYPIQQRLIAPLRIYGQQAEQTDLIAMWAGQSASRAIRKSSNEIFQTLIKQAETMYEGNEFIKIV